ncbi:MAG TPA: hypothetical protein VKM72_13790 [Thermoanaerobaculia bacterium]|nr:hypothetical protein [Thermoanaerobaculia bacterium]
MDASQMTCPKCGWAREPNAVDCPACGIVFARFSGSRTSPAAASTFTTPPLPAAQAANPYAPPRSDLQSAPEAPPPGQLFAAGGVWRTGDLLVMQKGTTLPNRCLQCNQPASVQYPKKMYWHQPWLYLLLFLGGPLVYIIGSLVTRKKADVVLPLCDAHSDKRKRAATISTLMMISGLLLMFASCTQMEGSGDTFALLAGPGFLLLFIGAIVSVAGANPIIPKKIDDYYVWLRKVSSSYLAALPPAPPGL